MLPLEFIAELTHGEYETYKKGEFEFTLAPRPHYCDLGRYIIRMDYDWNKRISEFLKIVDFRRRFSCYFFSEEDAMAEVDTWLKVFREFEPVEFPEKFKPVTFENNLCIVSILSPHPLLGNYSLDILSIDEVNFSVDCQDAFPRYYYDWDILVRETNAFFEFRNVPIVELKRPDAH